MTYPWQLLVQRYGTWEPIIVYRECVNNHRDGRQRESPERQRRLPARRAHPPGGRNWSNVSPHPPSTPPLHATTWPDSPSPHPLPSPPLWTIRHIVSNAIPGAPLHVLSPLPLIPRTTAGYRPGLGLGNMEALRARPTDPTSVSYIGRGFFDTS